LLTAGERSIRGSLVKCAPSPFLAPVDAALLDRGNGSAAMGGRARRRDAPRQDTLF
jgi:hypothetical protein